MLIHCPHCQAQIPTAQINVSSNLAACPACNHISPLDSLLQKEKLKSVSDTPPLDSKIRVRQVGNAWELFLPPAGFTGTNIFISLFSVFWIGFVAVWTVMASIGGGLFALFSVPFWFVGVYLLFLAFNGIFSSQSVWIENQSIAISKDKIPKKEEYTFSAKQIDKIQKSLIEDKTATRRKNQPPVMIDAAMLISGATQVSVFEGISVYEVEWLVAFMQKHLLDADTEKFSQDFSTYDEQVSEEEGENRESGSVWE